MRYDLLSRKGDLYYHLFSKFILIFILNQHQTTRQLIT